MCCDQLWNLDDGVPLTPRVAAAASFEHLITDDFRADAPQVLPEPWGCTKEDSGEQPSPKSATSRLLDNLDYLDSLPDWEDEREQRARETHALGEVTLNKQYIHDQ